MLRPYQLKAIAAARAHVAAGRRSVLIVSPCGTGKTATAAEIVRLHVAHGGRVLWGAHRVELVEQAVRAIGGRIGVIAAASDRDEDRSAPIQVASIQTFLARDCAWLDPTMVVFDESQFAAASEYQKLLTSYPKAIRIGLTATPERGDGVGLGAHFDCIVVATTIREATELGYLVPLDIAWPGRALGTNEIAQRPVDAYLEHATGRQAVVFAPHLKASAQYAQEFRDAGISAAVVTGEMTPGIREQILLEYDAGRIRALCNCGVLTIGWDSPRTGVCILARGCGSPGLYIQIVGRCLRPYPGKDRALLVDLRGVVAVHGRPDEDRVYSLVGKGIRRAVEVGPERFCLVCGALLEASLLACPDCGKERPAPLMPEVTGDSLRVLAKDVLAGDSPDKRIQRLAHWMREANRLGHKANAPLAKFRGLYKVWPTNLEVMKAKGVA